MNALTPEQLELLRAVPVAYASSPDAEILRLSDMAVVHDRRLVCTEAGLVLLATLKAERLSIAGELRKRGDQLEGWNRQGGSNAALHHYAADELYAIASLLEGESA